MKKTYFIVRQLLVGLIFLQLLNLSICSEVYWQYYNYSPASRYDPTESVVEWVIEWKKGNQEAFSYTQGINLKGMKGSFSWHVDPSCVPQMLPARPDASPFFHSELPYSPLVSVCIDTFSPPPEGEPIC